MAYVNDTLPQTFSDDNLVATSYNTFQVAELLEHQCVPHKDWMSLASITIASLAEWDELAELSVPLRCILNFHKWVGLGCCAVMILCTTCSRVLRVSVTLSVRGIMCLERKWAPFLLLGQYFNSKSNCCRYNSQHSILMGGLLWGLLKSGSRGRWSASMTNELPTRYR